MTIVIHNEKRVGKFTLGYSYRKVDSSAGGYYSQMYMVLVTAKGRKFASVFGVNEVTYDDNNNPVDICDISDEMIRNEMADVAYCLSLSIALERDEWVEVFDEIEIPQT